MVAEGGEGVVLKYLGAGYEDSSSRKRGVWVKVKKRIEYDAFVSGFKLGEPGSGWEDLVGALEFSVMTETGGKHVIGYCTNITLETRKNWTVSVKTWRYQEVTDHLLFGGMKPDFTAILDCESIIEKSVDTRPYTTKGEVTKTSLHSTVSVLHLSSEASLRLQVEQDAPLKFKVLDLVKWGDEDLRRKTYRSRLVYLSKFVS